MSLPGTPRRGGSSESFTDLDLNGHTPEWEEGAASQQGGEGVGENPEETLIRNPRSEETNRFTVEE